MSTEQRDPATAAAAITETKTFLIADVRGYSTFTRERGDEAAARLAMKFADLARDAVEARGGTVVELRGDEALAGFSSSAQAVRAAVEFQEACAEETQRDPELPLPVGIGIDAGEAIPVEDGYRGVALNMAARLCSKAGAGEVLVTTAVAGAASGLEGIRFEARGAVELKGFDRPVELLEAVAEGERIVEPPEAQPGAEPLPPELDPLTPLVDRVHEVRWLRGTWRQARRGSGRLVFVSGPSGIGKMRVVAALAAHVHAEGAVVRYAGPGAAGTALALSAIQEATQAAAPTLLVLNDLEALGDEIVSALEGTVDSIARRPVLIVGSFRNTETIPAVARVVERADERGDGHRLLTPLDAEGVAGIARLYVGDDLEAVPLESMVRASGGIPGRVHEVVSEWSREEARRRLEAAAEWIAAGRDKQQAELQFANNVIGLKLGQLYSVDAASKTDVCPYKGLASFEAEDAAYFFGRERLVGELAARTVGAGLLGVVGPSGSGKSSAVLAGLLPSLSAGLLPGSERWRSVTIRPGQGSVSEMETALAAVDPADRLVLVVDQFEELFTTGVADAERDAFVGALVQMAQDPDHAVVVVTIRADYYGHCAEHPEFAELLGRNHVLVGSMTDEELRRTIELPARRVGLRVESSLTEALVTDVADEPGALPLLSTALVELWHEREGGWLRRESHGRTGGVRGAVARLAETSFEQLHGEEREAARAVLLRLVAQGEGDAAVRRRVSTSEFDRTPAVEVVLSRFTEDRLLTRSDGLVEVAHEALIREWPRLREWLEEDKQGQQIRRHVTQSATQWNERGRDDTELYRGARLSATLEWSARHGRELNELEREFLTESREASERETERQRRTNRRLRGLLAGVAVFLVVALLAGALALVQRGKARRSAAEAEHSATVALAKSLGAQAVVEPRLDTAMLLARESVELAVNQQTRSTFLSTLLRSPAAIGALYGDGNRPLQIALSPDGRVLAIAENTGTVLFRDTESGRSVYPPIRRLDNTGMLFGPDGTLIVPGFRDFRTTKINVMDPSSGEVVRTLAVPKPPSEDSSLLSFAGRFSPDGRLLAMIFSNPEDPAAPSYIVQWDFDRGVRVGPVIAVPHAALTALGYVDHARRLVAIGTRAWIIDARSGRRLETYDVDPAFSAAVSADGTTAVLGHEDGSVLFLDLATGRTAQAIGGHSAPVQSVGFTPDGTTAITTGDDRKVLLWDVATHTVKETFAGHGARVLAQAVSRDGGTLYTSSLDGTVLEWDLSGDRRFGRAFQASAGDEGDFGPAPHLAVSPDGRMLATGDASGTVNLWDLHSLRKVDSWRAIPGQVGNLQFSPDGTSLLVSGNVTLPTGDVRSFLRIEDVTGDHKAIQNLRISAPISWSTFGPGGTTVASSISIFHPNRPNTGGWAVWDVTTGKLLLKRTSYTTAMIQVAYSPDGSRLALVGEDQHQGGRAPKAKAVIVDVPSGEIERHFVVGTISPALSVDFSPDGAMIATGPWDGHVQLWDVATGHQVGTAFKASDGAVVSVQFSPDGREIVTGGTDGTTRLFDVATQEQIGPAFPGQDNYWDFADFTPAGTSIVVVYETGQGYVWPATLEGWEGHSCDVARRNLSLEEWKRFVPDHPYERVCPQR